MKINAALVVAFLCLAAFIMPWGAFVSDPFYVHTYSILASSLLVIACYTVSRAGWAVAVQIIECLCIIYQSNVILNWDNPVDGYYHYHDEFMMCAFLLELLFISTSITKVAVVMDGITGIFRRSFLSFMRLYPSERSGINLSNDKEHRQC